MMLNGMIHEDRTRRGMDAKRASGKKANATEPMSAGSE